MITVYSTKCPRCMVLEKKLQLAGLEHTLVEDLEEVLEASIKYNTQDAPFMVVDDQVYNFSGAIKYINERK